MSLQVLKAANAAYRTGNPIMSDASYDALEAKLRADAEADPSHPASREVLEFLSKPGAEPDSGSFPKVRHTTQMTSLNKAQTDAEFAAWARSMPTCDMVWSLKLDGISLRVTYENGFPTVAATRGDGDEGEDIFPNFIRMKGVPKSLNGISTRVRGEIVLFKQDFMAHFPGYKNTRNTAAGVSKRSDGQGCQHLTFVAYQIDGYATKGEEFAALKALGFLTPDFGFVSSVEEACAVRAKLNRDALEYDVDGIVFDLNSRALADRMGSSSSAPNGAIAFKFEHATAVTTLRDVVWQVGKSGRITPVAVFDPVDLVGVSVSRATLHNISYIQDLGGLIFGDQIAVSRRNDVIPCVESVISHNETASCVVVPPSHCPSCQTVLVRAGEYLVCRGEDCPDQVVGAISRWVKKVGILGIGDSVIEGLIDAGFLSDLADLYTLDPNKIESVQVGGARLGRSAQVIVQELRSKMELPLYVLVGSLGIPLCSRSVCRTIEDAGYDTLEKMRAASPKGLAAIPGMGQIKAESFVQGLASRKNLIDKLTANGVRVKTSNQTGSLAGKSFCFTGVRDPALEANIEAAGGQVKSSVVKGLTYLIAKDANASSGKLDKARSMGVIVISLDDARKLVGA